MPPKPRRIRHGEDVRSVVRASQGWVVSPTFSAKTLTSTGHVRSGIRRLGYSSRSFLLNNTAREMVAPGNVAAHKEAPQIKG